MLFELLDLESKNPKPQPTESHTEARAEAALRPIGISNLSAAFALQKDIPKLPNQSKPMILIIS
jgi:hypothetical protein